MHRLDGDQDGLSGGLIQPRSDSTLALLTESVRSLNLQNSCNGDTFQVF